MSEPWFKDGLSFRCTRCGNCCTGAPGFVWVNDEELRQIAALLREPLDETKQLYARKTPRGWTLREKADGSCVFYSEAEGCTIYPVRPRQCQSWPFWSSNLATPETWKHTCSLCPGAGQGELIPVEEIRRKLDLIRL